MLMTEPARYIRAGDPEWIVLEQVPGARPLYEVYAAELAGRGVKFLNGPMDRPWGIRTACFADPAGHIWEIAK